MIHATCLTMASVNDLSFDPPDHTENVVIVFNADVPVSDVRRPENKTY